MTDLEFYKELSYFLIGYGILMFLILPFELKYKKSIHNYSEVWFSVARSILTFSFLGVMLALRSKEAVFYVVWAIVYLVLYSLISYLRRRKNAKKNKK